MKWDVIQGDCLTELAKLPAESVHCCVTSPPYFGLRDYGVPETVWGGDGACEHEWTEYITPAANGIVNSQMQGETLSGRSATRKPRRSNFCAQCNAWRGSFGLEPSPELFVKHAVEIFREVRRVLRKDGTFWLNIGDSYNAYNANRGPARGVNKNHHEVMPAADRGLTVPSLKPKDLIGIPWLLAFALRADGWHLRMDIIWAKPNPMPESVRDRPTRSHEYLFLLTKSSRYYYDGEAVSQPSITGDTRRPYGSGGMWEMDGRPPEKRHGGKPRDPGPRAPRPGIDVNGGNQANGQIPNTLTRNARSVWTIATKPYRGAHFAVFPHKLVEPCILAGCPEGGTVLDPFAGSGTAGVVARQLGRAFIGIEQNAKYVKMARRRIESTTPPLIRESAGCT